MGVINQNQKETIVLSLLLLSIYACPYLHICPFVPKKKRNLSKDDVFNCVIEFSTNFANSNVGFVSMVHVRISQFYLSAHISNIPSTPFSEGVVVDFAGLFDRCWAAAPEETSFLSHFLFWVAVAALLGFLLLSSVRALGDATWRVQRPVVFATAFWFAWWFGTFMVIKAVSAGLGDTTCHRRQRHNAVSGHFGFFVFWNLSALWMLRLVVDRNGTANYLAPSLWRRVFERPGTAHTLAIAMAVLGVCSTLTLLRTWFLGYHSLRQCVLGSFVAVTSHYLAANSLDHSVLRTVRGAVAVGQCLGAAHCVGARTLCRRLRVARHAHHIARHRRVARSCAGCHYLCYIG
jgi:hypothetical protein